MATHSSAAKRNRQNIKRNERNSALRANMRRVIRTARTAIEGNEENKDSVVKNAVQVIYGAASKNIIKSNTASRYVSRLMRASAK